METIYYFIRGAFEVIYWLLIIRVILSWVRHNPMNPLIRFIYETTEPILRPFRKLLPPRPGMPIDFSPLIALLALQLLERLLLGLIF